jgi:hypothetical protein
MLQGSFVRETIDTNCEARDNTDRVPSESGNQMFDDLLAVTSVISGANHGE